MYDEKFKIQLTYLCWQAIKHPSNQISGATKGGLSTPQSKNGVPCDSSRIDEFFYGGGAWAQLGLGSISLSLSYYWTGVVDGRSCNKMICCNPHNYPCCMLYIFIIIWEEQLFLSSVWPGQIRSAFNEMGLGELAGSLDSRFQAIVSVLYTVICPISELISNTTKSRAKFARCTRTTAALSVSNDCTADQWWILQLQSSFNWVWKCSTSNSAASENPVAYFSTAFCCRWLHWLGLQHHEVTEVSWLATLTLWRQYRLQEFPDRLS